MPWNEKMELLQLQIPPELKEQLKTLAQQEERSLSGQVRKMLENGIKEWLSERTPGDGQPTTDPDFEKGEPSRATGP